MIIGMKRDYRNTIGKRIKLLRQDMKIQQNELAEIIGMTQSHLSQIERGVKRPTAPSLAKIAKALGTTVDYLLMLEDDEQREPEPDPIGYSEQAEEAARLIDGMQAEYTRQSALNSVQAWAQYETALSAQNTEKTIASALNAGGIPSPGGATWTRHTVNNILSRAHWYAGIATLNRKSRTGRQLVTAPAQWQAIIDADTYERIEEERRARMPNRKLADAKHLLSGVCVCQVCGAALTVAEFPQYGYAYLTCRQRHGYLAVRDYVVLAAIREHLDLLRTIDIETVVTAGSTDATTQIQSRITDQHAIITKAQQALQRIDNAYADGLLDAERYRVQVDRSKAQVLQAAAEIARLTALFATEAEAGTRRQRLEYARDHAGDILAARGPAANAYLRRLLKVWCNHKQVVSVEWL